MDEGKRQRLFDAAMGEFLGGYEKTSTDRIVARAGISKGLLFHYFPTKREFFLYLSLYAFKIWSEEFIGEIDFEQPDFLERLWQITLLEIKVAIRHPALTDFILVAYKYFAKSDDVDFMEYLMRQNDDWRRLIYENIDKSLFKEDLDVDLCIKIVLLSFDVYGNRDLNSLNYDKIQAEVRLYIDEFRKLMYKTGRANG